MDLTSLLHRHFGFSSFRAGQQEAIHSLLNRHHTLVVMPTGAGKSLIFQLAALELEGITLVISPLIALMKDQVDSLTRRNISATYINSTLSVSEQNLRLQNLSQNKYRLIYAAPERLRNAAFLNALRSQKISLLAVDEAHCLSEWGHDFRPDYLYISQARRYLGNPLTVALTATATPKVQNDIVHLLGLPEATRHIITGFNRPNLMLEVKYTHGDEAKFRALSELLRRADTCTESQARYWQSTLPGAIIIYTGTRRDAEEVAEFVRVVCKLQAEHYHAGLPAEERAHIQERFVTGATTVIVATNAFGMGIDRADVRQVIHYSLPGSLEACYQEAGRAGRDGHPAKAVLLYDPQDRALQEFFIENSVVTPDELQWLYRVLGNISNEIWLTTEDFQRRTELHPVKIRVGLATLERAGALEHLSDDGVRMSLRKGKWDPLAIQGAAARNREHICHRTEQLDRMIHYAETNSCRRRIVFEHFGDHGIADAAICCDNCQSQRSITPAATTRDISRMTHAEKAALVILGASHNLKHRVGTEKLAQILAGSKSKELKKFNYDKSPYFDRLNVFRKSEIERMIEQLVEMEYLKIVGGMYPVVALTPKGEAALKQRSSITLKTPKPPGNAELMRARAQFDTGGTVEYTARLFADGLRPEQIAKERGLTLQMIYDHLAQLISIERIPVEQVVPGDVRHEIEKAIDIVGNTRFLSPIKALLPGNIDFNMIRCVAAAHAQLSEVSKLPETRDPKSVIQRIVDIGESRSSAALPELYAALKSEDGNARRLAASALGKIKDAQAVQPLLDLLVHETKPQVRQYAVKALGNIGEARAIVMLTKIADDENEMYYTRDSATRAIRQIHAKSQHTPSSSKTRYAVQNIEVITRNLQPGPSALPPDPVSSFLLSSHPRPLKGNWHTGFALDFHSSYKGADWNRSEIGDLVYRLKYESDASVLPVLVEHTRHLFAAQPEMSQFDIIVPVPSSAQREFSPVHEFCRELAKSLNKPTQIILAKTRQTKPQKEMHTFPQKRDNVTGAFRVNSDITGRRILLVDDLFDSGTTLEEITRLLLKHGASCVNVLTLTRTIHSDA